ncbi:MAG: L-aspartate oxidase [Candidatus Desulforudis sp.]|nr:L-aspartate oxidase [Desulforudis sp.]
MTGLYILNFDTRQLPSEAVDYLVVGSGIAGLYTAYLLARSGRRVVVVTKKMVENTSTERAQGGIAAAIGASDSPLLHLQDTLRAGAGLCDPEAVQVLVTEGPYRVRHLVGMGARFDRTDGGFALVREGAHRQRRILYAGGDATGAEIQRTLCRQVNEMKIPVLENHFVVDLLVAHGQCCGALVLDETANRLLVFRSRVIILTSGGAGQLFRQTTNPPVATGDGIAVAFRAGAEVADLEFIQFHPTVLALADGPPFLISEAVRGEGGILRNASGKPFMSRYHPDGELAPRDVVTRAILAEMRATGTDSVFLDVTHLPADKLRRRFPTIAQTCTALGLDICRECIPVAPAAHYMMGGVRTNLYGETTIENLYACGEVACAGVHGANRLASNSLVDGLVFGGRIVERVLTRSQGTISDPDFSCALLRATAGIDYGALRSALQEQMDLNLGPIREPSGLEQALRFFEDHQYLHECAAPHTEAMEVHNLLQLGLLVTEAAAARRESRGGHYRTDYPQPRECWRKNLLFQRVRRDEQDYY